MADRLEPLDPIEKVLRDLGQMRGSAATDLLRLPLPSPFKRALEDVDRILGGVEDDIHRVHGKALRVLLDQALPAATVAPIKGAEAWAAGLRARFGWK